MLPLVIEQLILQYAQDMDLLEQIPGSPEFQKIALHPQYPDVTQIENHLLRRYSDILFSNVGLYDINKYIQKYIELPLNLLRSYRLERSIYIRRCGIWGTLPKPYMSEEGFQMLLRKILSHLKEP
jgi:hypothetical protein